MKRSTSSVALAVAACFAIFGAAVPAEAHTVDVGLDDYDAGNFSNGGAIDNRYLPLPAGLQLTFDGTTSSGAHRIVFTVTDLTKEIDGVQSRVIYDVDSSDGVTDEAELAFMAQDDDGNVWNTGEYPEVYDNGVFSNADATWINRVEDAFAGVGMRAHPRAGSTPYLQGFIESIEFKDEATILGFVPKVCVPVGCFRHVLKIQETNLMGGPADGIQLKYYARGVGNIKIDFAGGDRNGETLELTKIRMLEGHRLAKASNAALALDTHAYEVAPDLYGDTPPAVVDHHDGDGDDDD